MGPQADLIKLYRDEGGAGRPVQGGTKSCWAPDAGDARATMRRLWPNDSIPGESAQLLPLPRHFGQLAGLITEDMVTAPCGPDPEPYVKAIRAYEQAGFDQVYLGQVGGRLEGAFEFFATQVLPGDRVCGQRWGRPPASVSSPATSASVTSVARMAADHPVSRAGT
jgi:hypothetical protein